MPCKSVWTHTILVTLVLVGCQKRPDSNDSHVIDPNNRPEQRIQLAITEAEKNNFFQISNLDCMNSESMPLLSEQDMFWTYNWDGSTINLESQIADSGTYTDETSFKTVAIEKVFYGIETSQNCKVNDFGRIECHSNPKIITQPKVLKICKNESAYPRNSVESVALTSSSSITHAWNFYHQLNSSLPNIKKAALVVLPKFYQYFTYKPEHETTEKNYSLPELDNLAYIPAQSSTLFGYRPKFLIYPTSDKSYEDSNLNLWESAWGLAHEFGHYVLDLHGNINGISNLSLNLQQKLREPIQHQNIKNQQFIADLIHAKSNLNNTATRQADFFTHWGAIHEGFADLFGFYANNKIDSTVGMNCFAKNRNISSPYFQDSDVKKTIDSYKYFDFALNSENLTPPEDCNDFDGQSIHHIGTIIGTIVYNIFKTGLRPEEAPNALLLWGNQIHKLLKVKVQSDSNLNNITIKEMIREAIRLTATKNENSGTEILTKEVCDIIQEQLPAFSEELLSGIESGPNEVDKNFTCSAE